MLQRILEISYNSNGGIPFDQAYGMPTYLRNFTFKWLLEQKKKEKEAYDEASKGSNTKMPSMNKPNMSQMKPKIPNMNKYKK